jgi:hypothetical protein
MIQPPSPAFPMLTYYLSLTPFQPTTTQISDLTADLLPQSVDDANKYVGFVSSSGTSTSHLQAYLNGGFLLSKNLGIDLRVVSVSAQTLKFQWKTNQQKVRV